MMQSLSLLGLFATTSFATKLLLPLYQYPSGTAYNPVYSAVEANPQVDFQIILNADSGPASSTPDSAYATAAAKLASYANVQLLGYVHCLFGETSTADVIQNATDWAAWNTYTGATISIDGIFFDETPNTQGGTNDVSFVQTVVTGAAAAFGTHAFTSMLNPGASAEHSEFWTIANYIVIYEDVASEYSSTVLTTNIPSGKASQSSILIPQFADVGTASVAQSWLAAMVEAGVGSAHILNQDYIEAASDAAPIPLVSVAVALASIKVATSTAGLTSTVSPSSSSSIALTSTAIASSVTQATSPTTLYTSTTITTIVATSTDGSNVESSVSSSGHNAKPTTAGGRYHRHPHWS